MSWSHTSFVHGAKQRQQRRVCARICAGCRRGRGYRGRWWSVVGGRWRRAARSGVRGRRVAIVGGLAQVLGLGMRRGRSRVLVLCPGVLVLRPRVLVLWQRRGRVLVVALLGRRLLVVVLLRRWLWTVLLVLLLRRRRRRLRPVLLLLRRWALLRCGRLAGVILLVISRGCSSRYSCWSPWSDVLRLARQT